MPFLICLPSTVRYWTRRINERLGRRAHTDYDAIWYEGSATRLGFRYWKAMAQKENQNA